TRRHRVAQATVVPAVPPIDEIRALPQAGLEHHALRQDGVVSEPIHHHLADDGPDPMRLGCLEGGLQAWLVDGAIHQGGRGPRGATTVSWPAAPTSMRASASYRWPPPARGVSRRPRRVNGRRPGREGIPTWAMLLPTSSNAAESRLRPATQATAPTSNGRIAA